MALHLYRRHRADCDAGRPNEFRSSELDERRKGWGRQCRCQIQVSGTLGGKFSRKTTGSADWAAARRFADEFEKAGSWNGTPIVLPRGGCRVSSTRTGLIPTNSDGATVVVGAVVVVVVSWAEALHGLLIIVPAANVAGTAAAEITTHRTKGERFRAPALELSLMLALLVCSG